MKKLFITCALITSASISFAQSKEVSATMSMDPNSASAKPASAQAQPATKLTVVEQIATRKAKTLQTQYNLTSEQYQKVYDAEFDMARQEHEIAITGGKPGPGQMYQMQLGHEYKLKAIMTPSQFAKYEAATPRPVQPGMEQQSAPAKH